jgi:protease stability complex PrcB-like protein
MLPRAPLALVLAPAMLLGACAAPASTAGPTQAGRPGLVLQDVEVEPVERPAAAITIAFDADAAAGMVVAVPQGLDFTGQALICVYLGERPTAGWRLDLDSAALVDGELRVLARENRPRGDGGEQQLTYPADCAVLNRDALPTGELTMRAHDTIADESIVSGSVVVPAQADAP